MPLLPRARLPHLLRCRSSKDGCQDLWLVLLAAGAVSGFVMLTAAGLAAAL